MKKLTAPTSLPKVSAIDTNRYELAPVFDSRGRRQDINDPLHVATDDIRKPFGVSDVWIRRRIAGTIRPMKQVMADMTSDCSHSPNSAARVLGGL